MYVYLFMYVCVYIANRMLASNGLTLKSAIDCKERIPMMEHIKSSITQFIIIPLVYVCVYIYIYLFIYLFIYVFIYSNN